jgi:hypothetical protein
MKHVRLHTPRNPQLSSGIILLEVDAMTPDAAVTRLLERRVMAPPRRLTPSPTYGERRASSTHRPTSTRPLIAVRSLARS